VRSRYYKTSIKLAQPLQHNRIKLIYKFSALLLLICCYISDFVVLADSEKIVANFRLKVSTVTKVQLKLVHPQKKFFKQKKPILLFYVCT